MNKQDQLLDEIIALKDKLNELFLQHYVKEELFSITWWISIALIVIPLIVWWKTVDKKRLMEIMIFGFACNMISSFLDVFLSDYLLWEYPVRVIPQVALLVPVDYVLVPVIGMIIYQTFPKWGPFLLVSTLTSAAMSFIGEPLAVAINMYKLISWQYVYSFPIYIAIFASVKLFTHHIVKLKGAGK